MLLTIPYLNHCLASFSPTYVQQGKPDITINAVELFKPRKSYDENTLYIGKADAFPDEFPCNFVFIGKALPPETESAQNCNLIFLPPETDLTSLLLLMCQVMLSGDVTERFAAELLSSLSNSDRLKVIAEIGYRYFGNPIVISDKNWRAIAMAPDKDIEDDHDWMLFRRDGMLSIEAVTGDLKDNLAGALGHSSAPFYWKGRRMEHPRLYSSVNIAKRPVATISVLEYNKSFSEQDYALLPLMSAAVSAEMQKTNNLGFARGLEYEEFISDLLEGRITSPVIINGRLKSMNMSLKKYIYLYVVDVSSFNLGQFSLAFIRDYLEKLVYDGRALVYRNNIVMLRSSSNAESDDETESMTELINFLREHNALCGVSRSFSHLTEIRGAYHQAMEALSIGIHIGAEGPFLCYSKYYLYHVAKLCSEKEDLLVLCHPKLLMLIDYDKEHNTAFTDSLFAFFSKSRNITQAAAALHLHRNSMIYHLKKIEEITGLSLSDPETLLHLEMSFRFLQYGHKYSFSAPSGPAETE